MKILKDRIARQYQVPEIGNVIGIAVDEIEPPKYLSTFVVTCQWMIGDGDGEVVKEFAFSSEADLKGFIQFCVNCANAYPNGKGGYEDYAHVDGYELYVYPIMGYWPMDGDSMCFYSFECFSVAYYNEHGIKHKVSVIVE